MRIFYIISHVSVATILFVACALTNETNSLGASSLGDRTPHPIEVPTMRIPGYTGPNEVIEVSREWPRENRPPDFQYAEPPIVWPNPIKVTDPLEIEWTTDKNPAIVDIWLYDNRDADGIPINNPIVHFKCGLEELIGREFPVCNFSYRSNNVKLGTDLLSTQILQAEIVIIQAEWLTLMDENSRVARASWALVLNHQ